MESDGECIKPRKEIAQWFAAGMVLVFFALFVSFCHLDLKIQLPKGKRSLTIILKAFAPLATCAKSHKKLMLQPSAFEPAFKRIYVTGDGRSDDARSDIIGGPTTVLLLI